MAKIKIPTLKEVKTLVNRKSIAPIGLCGLFLAMYYFGMGIGDWRGYERGKQEGINQMVPIEVRARFRGYSLDSTEDYGLDIITSGGKFYFTKDAAGNYFNATSEMRELETQLSRRNDLTKQIEDLERKVRLCE